MKKNLTIIILSMLTSTTFAQTRKDGSPDMRYNVNKGIGSMPPVERNYSNGGQYKVQNGYVRKSGTYVQPHIKTTPDRVRWNNYKPRNK